MAHTIWFDEPFLKSQSRLLEIAPPAPANLRESRKPGSLNNNARLGLAIQNSALKLL